MTSELPEVLTVPELAARRRPDPRRSRMHTIYVLCDPRPTGKVYVGQTSGPVRARVYRHFADAVAGAPTCAAEWFRELDALNLWPIICQVERRGSTRQCREPALEVERRWINRLRHVAGADLLNDARQGWLGAAAARLGALP